MQSRFYPQPRSKILTVISIPEPPARLELDTGIICSMLEQYVDQGDVQSAVSMMIVLGGKVKSKLALEQRAAWVHSYLELLSHFELWNIANQVIILNSDMDSVRCLNQQSTTVHAACDLCDKALPGDPSAGFCSNCLRFASKCCICDEVIKGLYVWCQGCSHGGHVQHLKEWFSKYQQCPTGCGHLCEFI